MDAPLDQPLYGASFGQAVSRFFKKYATFTGRASRSEYWWIALLNVLVFLVLGILAGVLGSMGARVDEYGASQPGPLLWFPGALIILYTLAVIIPSIALGIRRLHDANLAGWFILLNLIPSVGGIIMLVLTLLPSNPAGARFDRR
jgi:uncharacterized membrane protein YhaH (DUF805 family)